MKSLKQDKVTNITFYIDDDLVIYNPNRSFLRLLNVVSSNINLKDFLVNDDYENIIENIKNFHNHYITRIMARETEYEVLLAFEYLGDLTRVNMLLLNNLYEDYENLNIKNKEYEMLLTSVNYFYWFYDSSLDLLVFKNTRELGVLFQGTLNNGIDFIKEYFNINDENDAVNKLLLYDIENNECSKLYKYKTNDNVSNITLKTKEFAYNDKKYFVGYYTFDNENMVSNKYIEKRDGLTGLYNKKAIADIAKNHIDSNIDFSLVIIDIDRFKHFNDTFGHAYGDKVIVTVANILEDTVKGVGYAGRIGGDEFMCVVEKTDEDSLRSIIRDIRLGVQWTLNANTPDSVVTCSIGISRYPLNAYTYQQMFDLADTCLYIAKNKGRNCYIIYKPEMHDKLINSNNESKRTEVISRDYYNNVKDQYNILQAIENKSNDMLLQLSKYLGVDKITIYDGNYDLVKMVGDEYKEPRKNYIKDKDYFKYYNNLGYFLMDNTNVLDTLDKVKYDMYLSDNIATSLEVLKTDESGNVLGLICFDKFKPAKTFKEEKVKFALFICDYLI